MDYEDWFDEYTSEAIVLSEAALDRGMYHTSLPECDRLTVGRIRELLDPCQGFELFYRESAMSGDHPRRRPKRRTRRRSEWINLTDEPSYHVCGKHGAYVVGVGKTKKCPACNRETQARWKARNRKKDNALQRAASARKRAEARGTKFRADTPFRRSTYFGELDQRIWALTGGRGPAPCAAGRGPR